MKMWCKYWPFMAILKTNKNNQKVLVRNFVLLLRGKHGTQTLVIHPTFIVSPLEGTPTVAEFTA